MFWYFASFRHIAICLQMNLYIENGSVAASFLLSHAHHIYANEVPLFFGLSELLCHLIQLYTPCQNS